MKHFSERESKILEVLGRRKMTISEITEQFYENATAPLGANNNIASAVRRINAKCEYYKLPWFLAGDGAGRGGKTIWKENRK